MLAALAGIALASPALAVEGLTVTGDVHGASAYQFRGEQFSAGDASIGFKAKASHLSGVFGQLEVNSVKLPDAAGRTETENGQYHTQLSGGYAFALPHDVQASVGLARHQFSGGDAAVDHSFTELTGEARWLGFNATLAHVVTGDKRGAARFGDTFGELGYTYPLTSKVSVGTDIGFAFYGDKHDSASDGLKYATVRAAYQFDQGLSLALTHQLDIGERADGSDSSGNNKTYVSATYAF